METIDPGLRLECLTSLHPITGEEIPVYTTSYVLNEYGNGAIMGVPAHDERDFAFATKNRIPITQVISPGTKTELPYTEKEGTLINSQRYDGLKPHEA